MVSGECHYLWSRRYRLNIVVYVGKYGAKLGRGKFHLYVNHTATTEQKALALTEYYREALKKRIADLLRIWLNLELAKKPPECLEYILVHELVHLLERNHNERFKAHMDKLLPNWQERKDLLNRESLAYSHWLY